MASLLQASKGLGGAFRVLGVGKAFASRGWSSCDVILEKSPIGIFDAVLVTKSPIKDGGSLVNDARKSLGKAAKIDELLIKRDKDALFVGNARGLDLANLATELAAMKAKMNGDKAELDLIISDQERQIQFLMHSHDQYKLLRGRYLSTFGRVSFGIHTKINQDTIAQGNLTAHWGDATFDASLYIMPNARTDPDVFQRLYGICPQDMARIKHEKTIQALNTHAGVLSSDIKKGTPKFFSAFATFIKLFVASGFDESYLSGEETDVTRAYNAFVACIASGVERVRPARRS